MQHQKIINQVAQSVLGPAGFLQVGSSRLWYQDNEWFACFADFQPFSGSRGTTLNYGISWLWHGTAHWTFDICYRADEFIEYTEDDSFREAVIGFSEIAVNYSRTIRDKVISPVSALRHVGQLGLRSGEATIDLAILAGLAGQQEKTLRLLRKASVAVPNLPWQRERNHWIGTLASKASDHQTFIRFVTDRIIVTRERRGMTKRGPNFF